MACTISCMISAVFVIGMIYFYNITDKSEVVKHYKQKLSSDQQKRYEKIVLIELGIDDNRTTMTIV